MPNSRPKTPKTTHSFLALLQSSVSLLQKVLSCLDR